MLLEQLPRAQEFSAPETEQEANWTMSPGSLGADFSVPWP